MIDHITYHVPPGTLAEPELDVLMNILGFEEFPAAESVPDDWKVRWWKRSGQSLQNFREPDLHLVEGKTPDCAYNHDLLCLGHFCVVVRPSEFSYLKGTRWCFRDSGSGRIWVGFANIRVEVRPL